ncbi:NUDIX hydrolase [Zavarzinia sp. CC-PAN008]|uniref:NUDIX hydrolase n=1 Tax=Zavarzinia sp. CC-PAN008 TaxID=3243332 RepID=UPI003F742DC2
MPVYPFSDHLRDLVAARITAFPRLDSLPAGSILRRAAVAITLVANEDGETSFLLTRRAPRLNSHGGQWALPGGRLDEGEDPERAALRELDEELGLTCGRDRVLGILDDYPTRSGYLITPVVIWAEADPALTPNPGEVASVFRIPLSTIAAEGAALFVTIPESPRPVIRLRIGARHLHEIDSATPPEDAFKDERFIHAPTAAVLHQFAEVGLKDRVTRVHELEQPVFAWR